MLKVGFVKSNYDSCLYFCGDNVETAIYLLLYVDDMLIACKHRDKITLEIFAEVRI